MTASAANDIAGTLFETGYCIIPNLVPGTLIEALAADLQPIFAATPFGAGDFYGYRTKRFGSLLKRSQHAEALVLQPLVLAAAEAILGEACDRIQLNVAQAIEIYPGELRQFPHRDDDMWAGGKHSHEYLVNVIWPIDAFTEANGATHIYPNSHGAAGRPEELPSPPVIAECPPGSAICFLGSTLHGAGANRTVATRRAVIFGYSLGWLKPYENLWLAYPPEVARGFSPELAALAGYAQHRPNLGNYEGRCPSVLLSGMTPQNLGAVDALRPDQETALAAFARAERGAP